MGQQQLLLVILVVIIIGFATVIAINSMQAARTETTKSSMRQDILMVLNDAQVYYQKPKGFGGGGKSFDGISKNYIFSIEPENANGTYDISGSGNSVTVGGTGAYEDVTMSAKGTMTSTGMEVSWSESTD